MATTPVTLNGVTYFVPQPGERGPTYDQDLTNYLIALATAFPQGGASPSSTFQALTSASANPATAGTVRLAKTDLVDWRNQLNTGNNSLGINSNDDAQWVNGTTGATSILSGQCYLDAFQTTAQTGITTATIIKYDSKVTDTDNAYNTSTGQFTVPAGKGGQYLVAGVAHMTQVTANGTQQVDIDVNGAAVCSTASVAAVVAGTVWRASFACTVNASAGQTIDVRCSTSGGTISTAGPNGAFRLSIKRLV